MGKFLQEVWLASGAARTQHLRRLMAGQEEPLDWLWQGGDAPEGAPRHRVSRAGLALSLALYQCWIAVCAPFTLGTAAGRRDLGIPQGQCRAGGPRWVGGWELLSERQCSGGWAGGEVGRPWRKAAWAPACSAITAT